jgi:hypothetical protein
MLSSEENAIARNTGISQHSQKIQLFFKLIILTGKHPFALKLLEYFKDPGAYI